MKRNLPILLKCKLYCKTDVKQVQLLYDEYGVLPCTVTTLRWAEKMTKDDLHKSSCDL